jgi:hypothetical protein
MNGTAESERKEILCLINDELLRISLDHGEPIMDFGSISALEDIKKKILARYEADAGACVACGANDFAHVFIDKGPGAGPRSPDYYICKVCGFDTRRSEQ